MTLPDLTIKFIYLEMAGRQSNCVRAYGPYEIRVVVQNIGVANAGHFAVHLNGKSKQVYEGLLAGHSIVLHFANITPSGQYAVSIDPSNRVRERDENNNTQTYFAPTPTAPLLCTATPSSTQ
jgi:subtilase family serine protease